MANLKILLGDLQNGMVVHHQHQWQENDRVTDPQGRALALTSEAAAAGYGISGAVDTFALLPDPTTLPLNTLYIVRQDDGAPNGNGLYRVEGDPQVWLFLDGLNLQQASEVPYDNGASGLTGTNVKSAIDELAGRSAPAAGDGLAVTEGTWSVQTDEATLVVAPGQTLVTLAEATTPVDVNVTYKNAQLVHGGKPIWGPDASAYRLVNMVIQAGSHQWWLIDRVPQSLGTMQGLQVGGGDNFQIGPDHVNGVHLLQSGTHLQADAVYSKMGIASSHRIRFDGVTDRWIFEDDAYGGPMFQAATTGLGGLTGAWELAAGAEGVTPPTSVSTTLSLLRTDNEAFPDRFYLPDASGFTNNVTWKRVGVSENGTWIYGDVAATDITAIYHDGTTWKLWQAGMDMGGATTNVPESSSPVGLTFEEVFTPATMGTAIPEAFFVAPSGAEDHPAETSTFAAARHGTGTATISVATEPGKVQVADGGVGAVQLAAGVAGDGLAGGAGSPLSLAPYADGSDFNSGSAWSGAAPATYGEAINRIASALATHAGAAI